jgi:hypothetical protein
MRERLLAAVQARLERFAKSMDATEVVSNDAVEELDALLAAALDPGADLEVRQAAGLLHWFRYLALERGRGQQEIFAALTLLAPIYQLHPDTLPDRVRQYFDDNGPHAARDGHAELAAHALRLLQLARDNADYVWVSLAIVLLQEALVTSPPDSPDRARYLSMLGSSLMARHERSSDEADLDRAIGAFEAAAAATPDDHPQRASYLANLGLALQTRNA